MKRFKIGACRHAPQSLAKTWLWNLIWVGFLLGVGSPIQSQGRLFGWGGNGHGAINCRRQSYYLLPIQTAFPPGIRAIAAGGEHTLALRNDGTVWAVGGNQFGQLGNGSWTAGGEAIPRPVSNLNQVIAIACGAYHSMALRADGTVWGWCFNGPGSYPKQVVGLNQVVAIGANVALRSDGTVWHNLSDSRLPAQVEGLAGITHIADGYAHALALKSDGTVWVWGSNWGGQLGDGTMESRSTPIRMTGLPTITAIAAGPAATFLLDSSKTVWVCGICPDGTTRTRPERIPGAVNIKAMSGEFDHALFLREDGKVMAYGANGYGELGDGTQERRNTLVQTQGVTQAIQVAAGGRFSLALTRSGTVLGWGANGVGQLGDGIPLFYMQGYHVASFPAWKEITGGASHVLALRPDNTVWAWGRSSQGQLGIGDKLPRSAPVQVMPDAIAVAAGREHSLTIRSDGTLWGWGNNNAGALSDNLSRLIDFPSPTQIPGQSGVIAVACKESLSGVVHANGVVQFWGDPFRGEPYTVTVPNAVAISAECGKIYILTSQGKVWVPRFHTTGLVAGEIQELNSVVAIASGYSHTLFLKSDGTVWAGGSNESGELGDAPAEAAHRQVSGLNHVCSIAAGRSFSLALKRDGSVWAWGSNSDGQLGDGTRIDRARPQRVKGVRRAFAISACGSAGLALCLPEGVHLNNDASPDLLWHNPQTGKIVYWYLDGTTKLSYETLSLGSGAPWQIVGTPDMNGDGKTDILWYNPGTGQLVVWYMQGITRLGYALYGTQVVAPWRVAAVYDANDDGKPDLLWHNPQTGQLTLWYMDNMRRVGAVAVTNTAATPWEVAGIADFNQDGNPDILWHNPLAGMVYLWFMQAEQYLGRQLVASEIFAPWRIVGTPDLNQDGFPDILWHNPAASPLAVWYMRGFIRTGSARLSDGVFAPWQVVRGN